METKGKQKVNISQSLIKRVWGYMYEGECGIQLRDVDILKKYDVEPTDPMQLGQYFEYLSTGQVNRDGSVPNPVVTTKGALTADSKRASVQAANLTKMLHAHAIEITDTGTVIQHEDLKIVTDALIATPKYEEGILDLKYSGLLGDKWHPMGWTLETFTYRHKLAIQPIFYKYVYWKERGVYDVPFFYAIHSPKNEIDHDIWEVIIPNLSEVFTALENEIDIMKRFVYDMDDIQPRPEMKRCLKCAMFYTCVFKEEVPSIKQVNVFGFPKPNSQSDKK